MECYYHPDRESTDTCAICGKNVCKECGLEIAGKIYCKDCLEKIVGLGIDNSSNEEKINEEPENIYDSEPNIYEQEIEKIYGEPLYDNNEIEVSEPKTIDENSPYNIKENINYSGGLESSYLEEQTNAIKQPQVTQNELNYNEAAQSQDFIYPDHSYEPQKTSARKELEDKYEKYLDDLYFDENEVPLGEQLAKDEQQYGSLTKKPYEPKPQMTYEEVPQRKAPKQETPEEMEARIRAEIEKEKSGKTKPIHNLNYQQEKDSYGIVDIILTIILVIVILIVLFYIVYLFFLSSSYPTFLDAVFALQNPQNFINNILN